MKKLSKAAKIVMSVVWGIMFLWGTMEIIGLLMVPEITAGSLLKSAWLIVSFVPPLIVGAILSLIIWAIDALIQNHRK